MSKTFYLTTTLPYVNAPLHMGHALEFIRADALVRYKKSLGYDVYFNTGTDEHGIKIFEKARESGISAQDFVDKSFETFREQLKIFGVSEDIHFIRTTDSAHEKAVQDFWNRVNNNGFIYKKNYEAKYCVGCESEKTESELVNDECPLHPGLPIKIINEENYFFKYSEFGQRLLDFYEKNPNFVIPDFRFNEIKNFIKTGLQDFSISRLKSKMPWGIEVPDDKDQVIYVWFDALVNYISTLGWPNKDNGDLFEKYWVQGTPTQYCGKDNTRFQAAMWQAMLIAAELPNSKQIIVNGFITGEGGVRMSKTLGNVIDPRDVVEEYGIDALRYFLLREVGSFEDSPFTMERFKDAYNSGLANGLGNLTSRILTLSEKYLIEAVEIPFYQDDQSEYWDKYDIKAVMDLTWSFIGDLDQYIQTEQPFKVVKVDENAGKEHIKILVQKLSIIARRLIPVMPDTAEKIMNLIKQNKKPDTPLFLRKE